MTNPSETNPPPGNWAKPVDRLEVPDLPGGAVNLNVQGRRLAGPLQGFGQMWLKTYRIRLAGLPISPQELIQGWKDHFGSFWPRGNFYHSPSASIAPGQVAVLNLAGPGGFNPPGGTTIATGILVIYADDVSFSFMPPEGHMFAGMITFSASREEDTVAQIQGLVRPSDPLYELTYRLGFGHRLEDEMWMQTLRNLAAFFKSPGMEPEKQMLVVDPRLQWSKAKNIGQNAAVRTTFYTLGAPFRRLGKIFK